MKRRIARRNATCRHHIRRIQRIVFKALPTGLGRKHIQRPGAGLGAKHIRHDGRHIGRPLPIPLHPAALHIRPPGRFGLSLGPLGLLKPPVPDLVGIFEPGHQPRVQIVTHIGCKRPDIGIIGQMRDVEPWVSPGLIGQIDHDRHGNPAHIAAGCGLLACILGAHLGPVGYVGIVGVHPVHKPQHSEILNFFKEVRVEHDTRVNQIGILGMIQLDIAQVIAGIARIGRGDGKPDLPAARNADHHPVIARADDGTAGARVDHNRPLPGPFQHIVAVALIAVRCVPNRRHTFKRGGRPIPGKAPDPAVCIQIKQSCVAGVPDVSGLGKPWAGHQKLIDERERGCPVDKPAQVGSKGWSGH